jgi:Mn-dependent DtxR family transcriptional regulator
MLIGGDFNSRAKQLLLQLGELCKKDTDKKIPVTELAEKLDVDRTELKNLLEYLENKELISIASIGGPFLYGHVKITKKGIQKALNLK